MPGGSRRRARVGSGRGCVPDAAAETGRDRHRRPSGLTGTSGASGSSKAPWPCSMDACWLYILGG